MESPVPPPVSPQFSNENAPVASKKNVYVLIAVAALVLIGLIVVLYLIFTGKLPAGTQQEGPDSQKQLQQGSTGSGSQKKTARPLPSVTVDSWTIQANPIQVPATQSVYDFKQNLTSDDFRQLASKLFNINPASVSIKERSNSIAATSPNNDKGLLYMQKDSGSFLYYSSEGIVLPAVVNSSEESQVASFVQTVMSDQTLKVLAQYGKKNQPQARYYEVHRDWNAVGMPILNLFGLFNIPQTQPLSTLSIATKFPNSPQDANVIDTSDNGNGLKRLNDFNTMTIGVKNGKVVSIASNIRKFVSGATNSQSLMTYEQAVEKLKGNQYTQLYTAPAGTGAVDYDKMYPNQRAQLMNATVTEAVITYHEDLPKNAQIQMEPYFIFRGTGKLATGYDVQFLATVKAVSKNVLGQSTQNEVFLAQSQDTGQKQGTFGGAQQEVVTSAGGCPTPSREQLQNLVTDPNGFEYGQFEGEWYVVTDGTWDVNRALEAIDAAITQGRLTVGGDGDTQARVRSDPGDLVEDFIPDLEERRGCPLRISGNSPTLFAYNVPQGGVTVEPLARVSYGNPALQDRQWTFVNSGEAYYEHLEDSFQRPQTGWNVSKNALSEFSKNIARQLGLNAREKERLLFELNHAAVDVQSEQLFIGLIPENLVNQVLPLSVSKTPNHQYRIHFYVSSASNGAVTQPFLQPIFREGFTLLEIGSFSQEK